MVSCRDACILDKEGGGLTANDFLKGCSDMEEAEDTASSLMTEDALRSSCKVYQPRRLCSTRNFPLKGQFSLVGIIRRF